MIPDHKVLCCSVPVRFWCTPRTGGRTLGSSPGTAGDTRGASCPQLRCCPPSPPDPEHRHNASSQTSRQATDRRGQRGIRRAYRPAGVWRPGTAASRPALGCTERGTRGGNG